MIPKPSLKTEISEELLSIGMLGGTAKNPQGAAVHVSHVVTQLTLELG